MNKFEASKEIFTIPGDIKDDLGKHNLSESLDKQREETLDNSSNQYKKDFLSMKIKDIDETFENIVNNELLKPEKYLDRFDGMLKFGLFGKLEDGSEEYKQIETYFNIKREELEKIIFLYNELNNKKEIIS